MEINNRKAINDLLYKYDILENNKTAYIEITEWTNGEGWDIDIDGKKHFSLSIGELDAINYLTKALSIEQ